MGVYWLSRMQIEAIRRGCEIVCVPELDRKVCSNCTYWKRLTLLSRYTRNSSIAHLCSLTDITMCKSPNCGSGQVHYGGHVNPKMTCITCGFVTYFAHSLPWHKGKTCMEFDSTQKERLEQEEDSRKYLMSNTKQCSGPGCGLHTFKEGRACDHITCK